jgi:hypothetical protein
MPPRRNLDAADLVTPTQFGRQAGIDPNNVRVWIHRSARMIGRKVEPLGLLGRWPAYDWNDLAALERASHQKQQKAAA